MRYPIWKKDDFFNGVGNTIYTMAPEVVELPKSLLLTWSFDGSRSPLGRVSDIRIENGDITGEVEFFDHELTDQVMIDLDLRLAGFFTSVVKVNDTITQCKLKAVSTMRLNQTPGWGS